MFQILGMLLIILLNPCTLRAQIDVSRTFIFGHSLLDHRPPAIPTPSNETTVPHWLYLIAKTAGQSFAAGGQYGFLPQHANLPPISQWGYDSVPGVWESDTEPFSAADLTTIMITAGNFVQWQAPSEPYPGEGMTSPNSATIEIIDWVTNQEEDLGIYIYENWPDMAPYISGGVFPPTNADMVNYHLYTMGDFHDWWIEYHDALIAARPDDHIKMIPVGPIISGLLTETDLSQVPITELYEDDAPHGRATIYFLSSLITYMGIYEVPAPSNYMVPDIIHPLVASNFQMVVDYIWADLLGFNFTDGSSRVFFNHPMVLSSDIEVDASSISIYPNPTEGFFTVEGATSQYQIDVLNLNGSVYENHNSSGRVEIDLGALPPGLFFIRIENLSNGELAIEKILKQD